MTVNYVLESDVVIDYCANISCESGQHCNFTKDGYSCCCDTDTADGDTGLGK